MRARQGDMISERVTCRAPVQGLSLRRRSLLRDRGHGLGEGDELFAGGGVPQPALPSQLAVARRVPSGEQATVSTQSVWPGEHQPPLDAAEIARVVERRERAELIVRALSEPIQLGFVPDDQRAAGRADHAEPIGLV